MRWDQQAQAGWRGRLHHQYLVPDGTCWGRKPFALLCVEVGHGGFSKAMALDLARYGIRVNIIAPTFIETSLTKPFFEDQVFKDQVMSKIKLGRLGGRGFDGSHRAMRRALQRDLLYLSCGWTAD
jgi:hypothetical protein